MSVLSDERFIEHLEQVFEDAMRGVAYLGVGVKAVAEAAIAADRAARVEPVAGWKWMSHPTRRNGEIVPVKVWNDPELGVVYLPFDEDDDNCLRWDLKSPDWVEHAAPPAAPVVPEDVAKDAERYRWLKSRMVGANFDWDGEGMVTLAFEMPGDCALGADCDKNIDAAMLAAAPALSQEPTT